MSTLAIIGRVKAKPGNEAALRQVITFMVPPTLREEGCLRFEMNESEDGTEWVASELWESRVLWQRHMESEHVAALDAAAKDKAEYFEIFIGKMLRPGAD
jgi:quinol monooxygenase YgiN